MLTHLDSERPIFIQIAEAIEDAIISGVFIEESQIPSTTEISVKYKINPATVLKGMNLLVDGGIIYKKRGIGMFVSEDAVQRLTEKRKNQFFEAYVISLIKEANKLKFSKEEVMNMIERGFEG